MAGAAGQFLLFGSSETGLTADDQTANHIHQLFEYDAVTGELVRVTKGEDGFDENGNGAASGVRLSPLASKARTEGSNPFRTGSNRLNMSTDGRTVVFTTVGALSQRARSVADGCKSVYEFRTDGPLKAGSVHLISDGTDTNTSGLEECGAEFQYMDGSGANILVATIDPLVAGDVDEGQSDVYDAREDGGFAQAPAAIPECQGEGCEGAATGPPLLGAPASLTQAPESPIAAPVGPSPTAVTGKKPTRKCAKGRKRVHGKCVLASTNHHSSARRASFDRRYER